MNYNLIVLDSAEKVVRECFFETHVEARVMKRNFEHVYPENEGYVMFIGEVGSLGVSE